MLNEVDLFESLESQFVAHIDDADGPTTVTMFCAHAAWVAHQIDECLIKKKQPARVFKIFKKYNAAFYEKIVVNLNRNAHEINLKGTLLALVNGNVAHLKRRDSMRLMNEFALKGVQAIRREQNSMGANFDQICVKYFDIAKRYCLNSADYSKLVQKFEQELYIDIVKLTEDSSPLGYKQHFPLANVRSEEWQQLAEQVL